MRAASEQCLFASLRHAESERHWSIRRHYKVANEPAELTHIVPADAYVMPEVRGECSPEHQPSTTPLSVWQSSGCLAYPPFYLSLASSLKNPPRIVRCAVCSCLSKRMYVWSWDQPRAGVLSTLESSPLTLSISQIVRDWNVKNKPDQCVS